MPALTINTNMMALRAANNLNRSYNALASSLNKLSSGLRINSAADDAAGLAIRELLRSDIATLNQGVRNANDAISMLQVMDGAAQIIDEKLIRMKELAEQAATGTYSDVQRAIMEAEFKSMRDEIERIAQATDFNGMNLLNGLSHDRITSATYHTLVMKTDAFSATAALDTVFTQYKTGDVVTVHWTDKAGVADSYEIAVTSGMTIGSFLGAINTNVGAVSGVAYSAAAEGIVFTAADAGLSKMTLRLSNGLVTYYSTRLDKGYDDNTDVVGNVKIHFGTGNDSDQDYYYVHREDFTAQGLGIDGLTVVTQDAAQAALDAIYEAILQKDMARAHFGSMMNRFSNTVTNLTIQAENLQAAESQISDVDVAYEMTNFMNTQIRVQAAVAMLSQANMMPQLALTLLQGA